MLASLWIILKGWGPQILEFVNNIISIYREAQLKKLGKVEKENEVLKNEKVVRDVLDDTNVDSLSDDEAFKPRQQ